MKPKGTILTVDWDFFVPENPLWDMAHKENAFFLNPLWAMRLHLLEDMKTNKRELSFWDWVLGWADVSKAHLTVSESHAYAYRVAHRAQRIYLVDAHHDCWPVAQAGEVACHDWGRVWLEQHPSREILWIHPDDLYHDNYPLPEDVQDRVKELPYKMSVMPKVELDAVHVCRSGCWTPPWLDQDFADFMARIEKVMGTAMQLQAGDWDAKQLRWNKQQLKEYLEQHKQIQAQMEAQRENKS